MAGNPRVNYLLLQFPPHPPHLSPTLGGATIAFSLETDLSTRLYPPPSVPASVHAGSEAL